MKKNKGLFVAHFDEKSGAPKALYNILKFILINFNLKVDIFVCKPKTTGFFENLKNELNIRTVPTVEYAKAEKKFKFFIVTKISRFFTKSTAAKTLRHKIKKYNLKYDFIFFNSVSFEDYKSDLDSINIPKYLYLHEGSIYLDESLGKDYSIFEKFSHIFVPSLQVKKNLIAHNLDANNISILPLFLDKNELITQSDIIVKESEFVVGNLAILRPNKAIEYFLATAKLYKELHPTDKVLFKWKGLALESKVTKLTLFEIQNAGLQNVVILEEYSACSTSFFNSIDVLMMTSKQETFGYVVLEAANNCKPSIAFNEVIGASEFIKDYGGFVADYLSINQLVDCLKKYYDDRNMLAYHGFEANKLLKSNYSLNEILQNELKTKLSFFIN